MSANNRAYPESLSSLARRWVGPASVQLQPDVAVPVTGIDGV